ncbi:MAG TPA: hypothetical protein VEC37_08415 [Bacillota bacterium]|nr:hypothetical protein [Bacillota bacterium]
MQIEDAQHDILLIIIIALVILFASGLAVPIPVLGPIVIPTL